jgi:hypothetical protein
VFGIQRYQAQLDLSGLPVHDLSPFPVLVPFRDPVQVLALGLDLGARSDLVSDCAIVAFVISKILDPNNRADGRMML